MKGDWIPKPLKAKVPQHYTDYSVSEELIKLLKF